MSNTFLIIELSLFFGLVLAWAFWEHRKTSKLLKETKEKERAAKADGGASETEA